MREELNRFAKADKKRPVREILVKGLEWNLQTRLLATLALRFACTSVFTGTKTITISDADVEKTKGLMVNRTPKDDGWILEVR